METLDRLSDFFNAIAGDPRISITHIGVYAALLQYWKEQNYANPVVLYSYDIMRIAKISSSTTYHKNIKDLNSYGYIRYEPSFKKNRGSKVFMLETLATNHASEPELKNLKLWQSK